jgi:hypothetical protein
MKSTKKAIPSVVGVYRISVLSPVYQVKEVEKEAVSRTEAQKYAKKTYGIHGWAEFVTKRVKAQAAA